MRDHYIICGYGRVGHQIAKEFAAEKVPYAVLDIKSITAEELEQEGIPYIIGSASSDENLAKAGIMKAKGLIASSDSDEENVFVTLSARVTNPRLYIIARASRMETEGKLMKAGANRVISPYYIAGSRIASMILRPVATDFLDIAMRSENVQLWMKDLVIEQHSRLANLTLREADVRKRCGALILTIKKKDGTFDLSPSSDSTMEIGDVVVALGTTQQLEALEKLSCS
jgi:voltage-gated potassium channel